MRQKIRIAEVLLDGVLCNDCFCLSISQDAIGQCNAGYWDEDSQFDSELTEQDGKLTYVRPESCIEENNIE